MKFYLMTGYCGSGKTTFAKEFAKKNNCRYISIDNFYKAVFGDDITHTHSDFVWKLCFEALNLAYQDKVNVVLDTNSPRPYERNFVFEKIAKLFDERYIIFVDTPPELCKENNKRRSRVIPEDKMNKIIQAYVPPTQDELANWLTIYCVKNNNNEFEEMQVLYTKK